MGISSYSTSLKSFGTTYLEEYLERRLKPENYFFDFGKICENWSSAFGKNACLFRIFDRELLLGNDIRRDFLEVLDIQNDSFDFSDDQHANESLSQVHSILLRAINSKLDDWGDFSSRIALHKRLWSAFEKEVPKVGTISSNLRLEYFSRFEASNKLFFDKYISGTDAFSPPSVRAASAPSFLSEPEFLKIVEGIVNVTVDNVLSGPEKIQQLQAELKKSQAELKKTQAELKKTVKTLRSTYRYPWKHLRQFLTRE